MADDMGYGDVGCYNPRGKIPTPNMDRLAQEGIRLTDAHSPSAVCTPTRYGVLTGRYCWRSDLKHGVLYGYEPPLIEPERLTVAGMLQNAGYHTAAVGKWHLGLGYTAKPGESVDFDRPLPWGNATREFEEKIDFGARIEGGPTELGFDTFFGASGCPTCQPPYGFIEDDRFIDPPCEYHDDPVFTSRAGMMSPGWNHADADPTIAAKAVEYIEERAGEDAPFFLYLTSDAPHEPCTDDCNPEFARGKSDAGPRGDQVWLFDWMVGEVLDALERTGKQDDTLIIVTSDNGALPGDRLPGKQGMDAYELYDHKSSGDWRGYKSHIWEGGHREPFIARWPGHIEAGAVSDALVCLSDFMSTCASIVGEDLPDGSAEDSFNILPILLGATTGVEARPDLIHHSATGAFSIRRANWKLVLGTQGSGGWPPPSDRGTDFDAPGQLYDIDRDPAEQQNLWDTRPDVVHELTALLDGYRERGRSAPSR
jgi:arylsulfatase A